MENTKRFDLSSAALHIIAMALMLIDHLWATVIRGNDWMNAVGRIAFPIFAFMLVEGYFHTNNLKKYVLRLAVFALVTEIPFNLALSGSVLYPIHQNVLFTYLIAIGAVHLNELAKKKGKTWLRVLVGIGTAAVGALIGLFAFVDYYHAGVLTVLVFYWFRGRKWWCFAGQLVCLIYINFVMLGGVGRAVTIGGHTLFLARQGFAVLALAPVWLYRGRRGFSSKAFKYINYAFYPAHLFVLWLLQLI